MEHQRRHQINEILKAALLREPDERLGFLDRACGRDEELRREVASLLDEGERTESLPEALSPGSAAARIGERFEQYEILSRLGKGGMGEVYLGLDTRLRRKVAIKFLPLQSLPDRKARKRLLREARAVATLDHPNICPVYEVDEKEGQSYIVMQYVEGETLGARLRRTPLDPAEALSLMTQVAEALSEAHAHGIVHRDIKPQNIIITPRGQVKVLDFGLAKDLRQPAPAESGAETESLLTAPGTVLGTVPYMSPEQARGKPVDPRSDLFSLGTVLYECLAARRAFSGDNMIDICAQVINSDPPPPSQFNPRVLRQVDSITMKALAKSPEARYQSAADLAAELRAAQTLIERSDAARTQSLREIVSSVRSFRTALPARRSYLIYASLLVALAVVAFAVWGIWGRATLSPPPLAMQWYTEGVNALHDGTYYKASQILRKAIEVEDRFALAHARLAEALMELDLRGEASDQILKAETLQKEQSVSRLNDLYLQGVNATVRRDFTPAIKAYQEIVRLSPKQPQPLVDLGRAYEKSDRIDEAIETYNHATKVDQSAAAAFLRLGILYGRKLSLEEAKAAFDQAEDLYRTRNDQEGIAEVSFQRGFLFNNINQQAAAREQFEHVRQQTGTSLYQRIRTLLQLSGTAGMEEGKRLANEALRLAEENRMESVYANGLVDLGNVSFYGGDFAEAEKQFGRALDHAQKYNALRSKMRAILSLGSLRISQGKPGDALPYITEALDFYKQGGYSKETSQALLLLGNAYLQQGKYDDALETFKKPLDQADWVSDLSMLGSAHSSIGNLLATKEEFPEALHHFDESYRIHRSLNARFELGYNLMHRANVLRCLGEYEEARQSLREASAIAERGNESFRHLLSTIDLVSAHLALDERRYGEAKTKSQAALSEAATQFQDIAVEAKYVLGLAQAFSGAKAEGKATCQQAYKMAQQLDDPMLLSSTSLALAEVLLEVGDMAGAFASAMRAQKGFEQFVQLPSEWKAWLIAARARQSTDGSPTAQECARRSFDLLAKLKQKWEAAGHLKYFTSPDIRHIYEELERMIGN
jgi:serine/threonine protein kinase/Flp pilus assembly protein TadD